MLGIPAVDQHRQAAKLIAGAFTTDTLGKDMTKDIRDGLQKTGRIHKKRDDGERHSKGGYEGFQSDFK